MGAVSSSQSDSTFCSAIYFYVRSRQSEKFSHNTRNLVATPATAPKSAVHSWTIHARTGSSTVESGATTSVKVKERRAWYHKLRRKSPVSDRGAKKSALIVRSLIVGTPAATVPKVTRAHPRPELTEIQSRLVDPKTANRIIAELRTLPVGGEQDVKTNSANSFGHKHAAGSSGPIHAVCLEHTDAEEDRLHFSRLTEAPAVDNINLNIVSLTEVGSASIDELVSLINEIHVIDLVNSPDFGPGQPGDCEEILAGAVPTPETAIKDIEQITPQLMALGYAAGKAILPDHKGIFPPTDRMSILIYWWGFELLLPLPSLKYLDIVQSIARVVMTFLTVLSLINNGVRVILPLVRYISQFIDSEFNQIKKQDQGKGVVCAATWIMPVALVPRPWDFPDPPISSIDPPEDKDELTKPSKVNPVELKPKPDPAPKLSPLDDYAH